MTFSAIIFDMDGLLVDSEPLWYEVEVALIESKGYSYAQEIRDKTVGLRVDEFSKIIYKAYPKVADSPQGIASAVIHGMTSYPTEKIFPRPGAEAIIQYVAERNIPRAIASSSPQAIIEHFVNMLSWQDAIPLRYSAEHLANGKPAPDVYLHTAKQLGVDPTTCLALEDSRNGARAAVAAGMTCYVVPDSSHTRASDFAEITPYVFDSLVDVLDELKTKRLLP